MRPEHAGNKRLRIRSKRQLLKLLCYAILLVLAIEGGQIFLAIWITKPVIARWGTIEKGCWAEAIFLWDETTIISRSDGNLVLKVDAGTRVTRGTILGYLYSGLGRTSGLNDSDLQMVWKFQALLDESHSLAAELKRINDGILRKNQELKRGPAESKIKEDLASLEQEKEQILRNIKNVKARILKIQGNLKDQLQGIELVSAAEAGYVYYQYDNWEGKFKPDCFYALTEEEFQIDFNLKSSGNKQKEGAIIGKVISPFNQLIAVMVDAKLVGSPEVDDIWWIKTPHGLHSVKIKNVIPLAGRKMLIALEDNGFSRQYMPRRRSKIFLTYKKVSGVMIPMQALYKKGRQTAVKLWKGDDYCFQEVQVLETDGEKAIVSGIDFGSAIISR